MQEQIPASHKNILYAEKLGFWCYAPVPYYCMARTLAPPGWRFTLVCKHTRSAITLTSSLQIPVENSWHKTLNMQNSRDSLFLQGENMQTLREAKEYTLKMLSQQWVQWIHNGTKPATSSAEKTNNAIIGAVSSHCAMCLNLNGCCFGEG